MPRTPPERPARGREAILDATAECFAERGYHGTSMRDIARACGLRPASLYAHWPGKEALLVAVVDRYLGPLERALRTRLDGPGAAGDRLGAMVEAAITIAMDHRDAFLTLSNDWNHIRCTPELAPLADRVRAGVGLWREALRAGVADGSLRADLPPAHILRLIIAVTGAAADNRYDDLTAETPAERARVVRALLANGLYAAGTGATATPANAFDHSR